MTHPKAKIENQKYEASVYYLRTQPKDPELQNYERLNDFYFSMPDIIEALKYVKECVRNPNNDESWESVLDQRFIPYKIIQWQAATIESITEDIPIYRCDSKSIIKANDETWILRIRVFTNEPEQAPPGQY